MTPMHDEIEVKFYPVDPESIKEILHRTGAVCTCPRRLMRRVVFDHRTNPQLDLRHIAYIRVRDESDVVTLTAKGHILPDSEAKCQQETQVTVSSFDDAISILRATGLTSSVYMESYRESWRMGDVYIEIDEWPGIEPYVEIEGPDVESIRRVAIQLGRDWAQRIQTETIEIYMGVYGLTRIQVLDLMRDLTFERDAFVGSIRKH